MPAKPNFQVSSIFKVDGKIAKFSTCSRSFRMKDFEKVSYPPVEHCIYCGKTEGLSKEHIIPYAMGSIALLPKASCKCCAKITGSFEQQVLRGPMWPVRVIRQLKSRTKHQDAAKSEPLTVVKDGKEQIIELPLEEHPILLPFPIFPPPAVTADLDYTTGIQLIGQITIRFGPSPEEVLKKLEVDQIKITPRKLYPTSFARMLAKIAYSYAFAEGVINALDGESVILPSILGKRDEIGLWVGTVEEPIKSTQGLLHRLALIEDREQGFLMAEVQLFSDSQTPSYSVILGKLK